MSLTYSKHLIYMLIISIIIISCDPAEVTIDPPTPGATFSAKGQIDGMDVDLSQDVILFTHTRVEEDTRIYGGQLHSECQNLDVSNCKRSLSITFMDSLNGSYDINGIPSVLRPGMKELYTDIPVLPSSILCIAPLVDDSVFVDGQSIESEYCIVPQSNYFMPVEVNYVRNLFTSGGGNIFSVSTQIMARSNGPDVEYYYFSYNCFVDSLQLHIMINIEGNSGFVLSDFDFYDLGGGGFNPNIAFQHPLLPSEAATTHLSFFNKLTGDVSHLLLVSFTDGPGINSFECEFPVSIIENSVNPVNNQGIVLVEYMDELGETYSSIGTDALGQSFIINSTTPYLMDEAGNETVTSSISFDGSLLSTTGRLIEIKNLDITFGFGFPTK